MYYKITIGGTAGILEIYVVGIWILWWRAQGPAGNSDEGRVQVNSIASPLVNWGDLVLNFLTCRNCVTELYNSNMYVYLLFYVLCRCC
jgi:hypothetical protein